MAKIWIANVDTVYRIVRGDGSTTIMEKTSSCMDRVSSGMGFPSRMPNLEKHGERVSATRTQYMYVDFTY